MLIHEVTLKEAKLPFNKIKGSIIDRKNKAEHMFLRFYRELNPLCEDSTCSIDNLNKSLTKVLAPDKIDYLIKEKNSKSIGSFCTNITVSRKNFFDIDINHVGYSIYLPISKNGTKINNKYVIFHEIRHFFDHLYNPKYNLYRSSNRINTGNNDEQVKELKYLFMLEIDSPTILKEFIPKAETIIKKIPNNIAIDTLQNIRCSLQTEINAYSEEINCLYKDKKIKEAVKLKQFLLEKCKFKAKLKYANEQLKILIAQERKNLRKNCNK